ncbi:hypothetical protein KFK09_016598 [Dendrobium nobile]|uniref:Uncharacterized protein n=1 Tax=Dendrobium nobile TaxID=94219 RepID=A0A8T3AYN9_DENNO|nr:hypothetical protein KFK09_016598 [Dendrobium nobile]
MKKTWPLGHRADFPQIAVHPPRSSSGTPLSTSNETPSAWKRKEFIPISLPSKATIVAYDGITVSLDMGALHANKAKLDGLNLSWNMIMMNLLIKMLLFFFFLNMKSIHCKL